MTYKVIRQPRCGPTLEIDYLLKGAEPNQSYTVTVGVFDASGCDGIDFFGVARWGGHIKYTRDSTTAFLDAFPVGKFKTNAAGDGQTHVTLDLSRVRPNTYKVQFAWGKLPADGGQGQAYYHSGAKFGQDLAAITVP
ncbi:MAG TPA: hypothetical protein VFV34_18080 [Blastocatellia bacterium]|nr:hypothetical protein [Blastocatellia bacterium]